MKHPPHVRACDGLIGRFTPTEERFCTRTPTLEYLRHNEDIFARVINIIGGRDNNTCLCMIRCAGECQL